MKFDSVDHLKTLLENADDYVKVHQNMVYERKLRNYKVLRGWCDVLKRIHHKD